MPAYRTLNGQEPNVADIAGLMGPLGLPGAVGGVLGRVGKALSAEDWQLIDKLLGRPMKVGKRLLRLSSVDSDQNKAIVHAATGERFQHPLDDFLGLIRGHGEDTPDVFPDAAVVTAKGIQAPAAQIGPKGGLSPMKRKL